MALVSAEPTTAPGQPSGLARYLPILGWLPRYPKSWFRPDLIAGDQRRRSRGAQERWATRGSPACPSSTVSTPPRPEVSSTPCSAPRDQIATGPSSALAAVAAATVVTTGVSGDDSVEICHRHHPRRRALVPPDRPVQDGLDLAVPVQGGHHRLPVRRRDRGGGRRAAQAHRHRVERRQFLAEALQLVRVARRHGRAPPSSSGSSPWR